MRVAIITGGAVGVWKQRALAIDLVAAAGHTAVYCAVNDSGVEHPDPLHHWVSLHENHFEIEPYRWEARRAANGYAPTYTRWSQSPGHRVDRHIQNWKGGSSSLTATDAMLNGVGCDLVILCGCPLDTRLNVFKGKAWSAAHRFRMSWEKRQHEFRGRVRSLSGWTANLLGVPSIDWLRGLEAAA